MHYIRDFFYDLFNLDAFAVIIALVMLIAIISVVYNFIRIILWMFRARPVMTEVNKLTLEAIYREVTELSGERIASPEKVVSALAKINGIQSSFFEKAKRFNPLRAPSWTRNGHKKLWMVIDDILKNNQECGKAVDDVYRLLGSRDREIDALKAEITRISTDNKNIAKVNSDNISTMADVHEATNRTIRRSMITVDEATRSAGNRGAAKRNKVSALEAENKVLRESLQGAREHEIAMK